VSDFIDAVLTPTFITFTDSQGREWKALALVAPLSSQDMDPVFLQDTKDLELKFHKIKVVRGGPNSLPR
jgi:hypothetical protein